METATCQIDILLEFLEVCFHSILFARRVYPEGIFTLKKKYNAPVHGAEQWNRPPEGPDRAATCPPPLYMGLLHYPLLKAVRSQNNSWSSGMINVIAPHRCLLPGFISSKSCSVARLRFFAFVLLGWYCLHLLLPIHTDVSVSLYPDLNQYISDVLKYVKRCLISNQLKQLSLWILDTSLKPVEKFVFNNFNFDSSIVLDRSGQLTKIEDAFRIFCLKLFTSDCVLKPIPDNSSFKIYIITKESSYLDISQDAAFESFPWVAEENIPSCGLKQIYPFRTLQTPCFNFEMYVEV